jgi:hypothetical protein
MDDSNPGVSEDATDTPASGEAQTPTDDVDIDGQQMDRRTFMAATTAAAVSVAATGAVSAQEEEVLNYDSDYLPNPTINGSVTVAEVGPDMGMLEYIADDDSVEDLADYGARLAEREDDETPHNPVGVSAGAIDAPTYGAFPRDEMYDESGDGDEETAVSALDATHWTTDESSTAGSITVADGESQGGADGLRVSTSSQTSGDTAVATFSEFETMTDGPDRRTIQLGVDVDTLESGAVVDFVIRDSSDNTVTVTIDDSLTLDDSNVVATSTGEAYVFQQQIGDLNENVLNDIAAVDIEVSEANADVLVFFMDIERSTRIAFGTEEYLDSDDEVDTQTLYEPSGWYWVTELGSFDDALSDATFMDVEYEAAFEAAGTPDDWREYTFEAADRYDQDHRFKYVQNFDLPAAFDLSYTLDNLDDEQAFPSGRYLTVKSTTGDETRVLDDADSDDVSWTSRTGSYDADIGSDVTITSAVNPSDIQAVYYDILVNQGERDEMTGTASVGGGPTGQSGGLLSTIFSLPGMLISGLVGVLGLRRLGFIGGE